ncbi:hypothetical protein GH733_009462 [Mirounga leonina]|nr:hypothetical protein GH733_009462 [Mirounga leonina]
MVLWSGELELGISGPPGGVVQEFIIPECTTPEVRKPLVGAVLKALWKRSVLIQAASAFYKFFIVVLSAGCNPPEEDFFRHPATQGHAHSIQELLFGVQVLFFGRCLPCRPGPRSPLTHLHTIGTTACGTVVRQSSTGPAEVLFFCFNEQVNHTSCQHGMEIYIIHQEWKIYEPHRPSPERELKNKKLHDGTSCSFEDEGSQRDYSGHGETG